MKRIVLFMSIFLLALVGCGQKNHVDGNEKNPKQDQNIIEIQLKCLSLCGENHKGEFKTKTFSDPETIKLFVDAMEHAEEIEGILNYAVMYLMQLTYEDKTTQKYYLNIDSEKDRTGLLVHSSNDSKGYTIPTKYYNRLSELLYE